MSMQSVSSKDVSVAIETITPEKAKQYLDHNCVNRRISSDRVKSYAIDMKNKQWEFNGEAIQFNQKGELINGQHRLTAIVKSGVSVKMMVMRNLPNEITLFDRGRTRSVADGMIIDGIDKSIATSLNCAMAKLHYYLQLGTTVVSDSMIRNFIMNHMDTLILMRDNGLLLRGTKSGSKIMNTSCAIIQLPVMYAIECDVPVETLKKFIDIVRTGFYDSPDQSAAVVIRNDLVSGSIDASKGSMGDKKANCYKVEKGIDDFVKKYPRRKSYATYSGPIYSNNEKFKEKRV